MFLALSSIILALSSAVTTFIQTITLSGCRVIECCSSSCEIDAPKKDDDLQVAKRLQEEDDELQVVKRLQEEEDLKAAYDLQTRELGNY